MRSAKIEGTKYIIFEDGRLVNDMTGRTLKWCLDGGGYLHTNISTNGKITTVRKHRLLAIYFIPNPLGLPEINHDNGIKTDCRLENLIWCTRGENIKHAYKTGLRKPLPSSNTITANETRRKKVIDTVTNRVFKSLTEAAKFVGFSRSYLGNMLSGRKPNKTTISYI